MLYDYLSEFATVVRVGSLSRASAELGVSQPALGRHLSALESHLGARLVTRDVHGVAPTTEGRYLLGMALDICSIGEEVERHFANLRQGGGSRQLYIVEAFHPGPVRAAVRAACDRAVADGLGAGMPLCRLDDGASGVDELLGRNDADVVVTLGAAVEGEGLRGRLHCRKVYEAPCTALVEPDSRFAREGRICLDDLAAVRVARTSGVAGNSDMKWEELRRRCLERGFSPLSYTTGFEARPYNGWDLPGCVVLFCEGELPEGAAEHLGKVALPLEGFAYEAYCVCRPDDALAVRVVDGAAELLGELPGEEGEAKGLDSAGAAGGGEAAG